MSVPNHAQVNRMISDLNRLGNVDHKDTIKDWRGNSYQGRLYTDYRTGLSVYELVHWDTTIAQFTTTTPGKVTLAYFNASYISPTTRGFQGRIFQAMSRAHTTRANDIAAVADELGKPTDSRGQIYATDIPELAH